MKINILVKESKKDKFDLKKKTDERQISIISFLDDESNSKIQHFETILTEWLKKSKLSPSDDIIDFCNLSLAVYNADTIVSRKIYGYYNWSRYFKIYLPVVKYSNVAFTKRKNCRIFYLFYQEINGKLNFVKEKVRLLQLWD